MEATKWELPSNRQYITTHPASSIAQLHSSHKMIHPVWVKVSKTAWYDKTQLCGGYGRRMYNTSISDDAPTDFFDPLSVPQPSNRMTLLEASVTKLPSKPDPTAAAKVLPGGMSMLRALDQKLPHNRFRSIPYDKQTYLDPIVTDRGPGPINWDEVSKADKDSSRLSGRSDRSNNNNNNNTYRSNDFNLTERSNNSNNSNNYKGGGGNNSNPHSSRRDRLFVGNTNR